MKPQNTEAEFDHSDEKRTQTDVGAAAFLGGLRMYADVLGREMAEREGFEPPVPVKVRLISSQVH